MIELGRALLSLLVPPRCLACHEPLDPERGGRVCPDCLDSFGHLSFEGMPCCPFCGVPCGPFGRGAGDAPCGPCSADEPPFAGARSWGFHDGALRDAILRLKFGGATGLAEPLGALLAHAAEPLLPADALIAIPLHPRRLRERGFNQAAMLAHAAAQILELPVLRGALTRTRETGPQTALDRSERAANVRGSFAADARVAGLHLLLVDDVFTTGATAAAAAHELLRAGASSVSVVTVARAARHEGALSATMTSP